MKTKLGINSLQILKVLSLLLVVSLLSFTSITKMSQASELVGNYGKVNPVKNPGGIVFTINSTDQQTGESLGSINLLVEGTLLKMTSLVAGNQRVEKASSIDRAQEVIIVDEANDAVEASGTASGSALVATQPDYSGPNKQSDMIYRADRREMVLVIHEADEYYVFDESFISTIKQNVGNSGNQVQETNTMMQQAYETALAQLDAQGLTDQERAAAEQMLKNTFGMGERSVSNQHSSLEILNLGQTQMNGYPTTHYQFVRGGQKLRELWVTDWNNLGLGARAQQTVESYFNFIAEMSGIDNMGFGSDIGFNFIEAMDEIGGFPVHGKEFEGGELDEEFSLKSITERDLDPDAFEPPKGYRLRTMGY